MRGGGGLQLPTDEVVGVVRRVRGRPASGAEAGGGTGTHGGPRAKAGGGSGLQRAHVDVANPQCFGAVVATVGQTLATFRCWASVGFVQDESRAVGEG